MNKANFTERLKNLPENKKKIIFFTVMSITVLAMIILGIILTKKNIIAIGKSLRSMDFPKTKVPKFDFKMQGINDIRDIDLKALNASLQETSLEDTSSGNNQILNPNP